MTDKIVLYPEIDYIGAVRLQGRWRIYYSVLGMWILDYKQYRPSYDPESATGWRSNLLTIDASNADQYCQTMNELSVEAFRQTVYKLRGEEDKLIHFKPRIVFVVDFDKKLFVNGWWESAIPFHKLLPEGWQGIEDDVYKYIPSELKHS